MTTPRGWVTRSGWFYSVHNWPSAPVLSATSASEWLHSHRISAPTPASAPYSGAPLLVPGVIYGVRAWKAQPDGRLQSISAATTWGPSLTAECQAGPGANPAHDNPELIPPVHGCTCGIYACYSKYVVDELCLCNCVACHHLVVGVIEAWGKAEVGSRGFRAQHARIVGLVDNTYLEGENCRTTYLLARWSRGKPAEDIVEARRAAFRKTIEHYKVPSYNNLDELTSQYPIARPGGTV